MLSRTRSVRKLVALISAAAEDAMKAYEAGGCDIPSLNQYEETAIPKDSSVLMSALRVLEGACAQLCATLAPPVITITTVRGIRLCFIEAGLNSFYRELRRQ